MSSNNLLKYVVRYKSGGVCPVLYDSRAEAGEGTLADGATICECLIQTPDEPVRHSRTVWLGARGNHLRATAWSSYEECQQYASDCDSWIEVAVDWEEGEGQ